MGKQTIPALLLLSVAGVLAIHPGTGEQTAKHEETEYGRQAAEKSAGEPRGQETLPCRTLLRFMPAASQERTTEILDRVRPVRAESLFHEMDTGYGRLYRLCLAGEAGVSRALGSLLSRETVGFAGTDSFACALASPNDKYYQDDKLWGLKKINAEEAWKISTGKGVLVAVVDSGCDMGHPDIKSNLIAGPDYANNDNDPQDDSYHSHGSHVCGTIAAIGNNKTGVIGLAYGAKVLVIKSQNSQGVSSTLHDAAGIKYAADKGAKVINVSAGETRQIQAFQDACEYAYKKGCVVVAASGNRNGSYVVYPASYNCVIAVGASDVNDKRWSDAKGGSTYGPHIDVVAPGADIWSLDNNGGYRIHTGTSMAAPHVAALAALIFSVNPKLSPDEVREIIRSTAVDIEAPGRDNYTGYGRIDAAAAVKKAQETIKDKKPEEEPGEKDPKKKEPVVARQPEVDPGEKLMEKAGELEKDRKLLEALEIYKRLEGMGERSRYAAAAAEKVRTLLADGELAAQLKEQQGRKKLESDLAMAESYLQNKIYDKALEFARKVIAAAPDSEQAKKAKDIIRRAEGER